jgi:hypothetical protein
MSDSLDDLLTRSLSEPPARQSVLSKTELGGVIRRRAARRDRVRVVALSTAVAVLVISAFSRSLPPAADDPGSSSVQVALEQSRAAASSVEIAALAGDLDATARLVRETLESMKSQEQTRELRLELSQYESINTASLAVEQTVAIGLADARRLASTRPEEASERLTRLVELFPDSALAADVKNQLHQLQSREVMP